MIARIWHGWTTLENADVYENLLKTEIFPGIAAKNIDGYRGIQLLRWQLHNEVEFITIMQFDSLDDVKQFVGEDYEKLGWHRIEELAYREKTRIIMEMDL